MSNSASNPVSTMDTKALQLYLDKEISTYKKSDWIGRLLLENITIVDKNEKDESITGTIDICQYLPGGRNCDNIDQVITQLRFDPTIFPPSESEKAAFNPSNPTYTKLREELQGLFC
jgi:hypothetical protein